MNIVLIFSFFGIFSCIFLSFLFISRAKFIPNVFLGTFFLLMAIKLGKLLVQTYGSPFLYSGYFNLVHGAFLALGPVISCYIYSYVSPDLSKRRQPVVHFIPSFIFLLFAFQLRQWAGEKSWLIIYWITLIHPLFYVFKSIIFLAKKSNVQHVSQNQKNWFYSLLGTVVGIVGMNILYFCTDFPFYLVTAVLILLSFYLFTFLLFNNKATFLVNEPSIKYKNLNLQIDEIKELQEKIKKLLIEEKLFLNFKIKLSDVAKPLNVSPHIISMVINQTSSKRFPEYVNHFRIEYAQKKLLQERDKKIIAIALESGFSSLSTFNRVFKKYTSLSPTAYRTKFSKK